MGQLKIVYIFEKYTLEFKEDMKKLFIYSLIMFMVGCRLDRYKTNKDIIYPYDLRCEYLKNPLGIDLPNPKLFWKLQSNQRAQRQRAYQIIVSSTLKKLNANEGDLWDTKKMLSSESIHIKYTGKTLVSEQECFWKVKVWDKNDKPSPWSEQDSFSMGLLQASNWKGKWIGLDKGIGLDEPNKLNTRLSARYLRKEFEVSNEIKRATVYMCGLGLSVLFINGQKIGNAVLSPALSQYTKRSYYITYEIASTVKKGKNAIGVVLGNGRYFPMRYSQPKTMEGYGFPKLIFQLVLQYSNGTIETIVSDDSWRLTANGPIVANSEYDGEYYDARKEMPGWNNIGFNDNNWNIPEIVNPASPILSAQMNEPIRVIETIKPVKITKKGNRYIVDLGQNIVGWLQLHVKIHKGNEIIMHFSESLNNAGELYLDNLRSAKATDTYIAKEDGTIQWEPSFTYHGFRFVEIIGFPVIPDSNNIQGKVVHDDLAITGAFECSNEIINGIYKNCVWGIGSNYRSIPTDCPQRDERQGWLGDRAIESKGESYIFDNSAFYSKWLRDIEDAQNEKGSIPDIAPTYKQIYSDNVTWAGAYVIVNDMLYCQFADKENFMHHYESMTIWMHYMKAKYLKNNIITKDSYGDWCSPPETLKQNHSTDPKRITSGELLSTTYYYYLSLIMERFAALLNKNDDAKEYEMLASQMMQGLNEHYYDRVNQVYGNNSATSSILPLAFAMVAKENEQKIFNNLLSKIMSENNGHISCGMVGCQWINRVFSNYGRSDIPYTLASNTTYPSWGYMIKQGATTIWELWNGNTANTSMSSYNHVMLIGDLVIWMYEYLGGIQSDIEQPGFKHIVMKPVLIKDLKSAKATHISMYGKIKSDWKIEDGKYIWDITVPVNCYATIYIPAKSEKDVKDSSERTSKVAGVKFISMKDGRAVFEVGSGSYHFVSVNFDKPIEYKSFVSTVNISPVDTIVTNNNKIKVCLNCLTKDAQIHYTTDGSEPTNNSTLYTGPFEISHYCNVEAKAYINGYIETQISNSQMDIYDPKLNGWLYKYYEGNWDRIPNFENITPQSKGKTFLLNISNLKHREYNYGFVFYGKIKINNYGDYTFYSMSQEGSEIFIDNKLVVNNDGIHPMQQRQGSINLTSGMHEIRIEFFKRLSNEGLVVTIHGPEMITQRLPVAMIFND